jgi:hypothetical protein
MKRCAADAVAVTLSKPIRLGRQPQHSPVLPSARRRAPARRGRTH